VPDRFDRGETAAEANPSFGSRATFDRSDVPRDPLDRTGVDFGDLTGATRRADADDAAGLRDPLDTRSGTGLASRTDLEPVGAGVATGASVGGLLGEQATQQAGATVGEPTVNLGSGGIDDTETGTQGDGAGTGLLGGTETGTGSDTAVAPFELIRAEALTGTQAAQDALQDQAAIGLLDGVQTQSGTQEDLDQPRDATPRPNPRFETPDPRPRPRQDIEGPDPDPDEEEPLFGTAASDALVGSGIAEAEDIAGDAFDIDPDRFEF
jgi:hypothetical protein